MQYLVDWWTLWHILGWATACLAFSKVGFSKPAIVLGALAAGLCWECLEQALVEPWLGFREPWWNRWLSDPAADLTGSLLGLWLARTRFPRRRAGSEVRPT
jgi:hypothetical protein